MQPIRDLDQIRGFLSGLGPTALFDMPFMPIFFIGCFMIHPWLGCPVGPRRHHHHRPDAFDRDARASGPMLGPQQGGAERHVIAETSRRNAEAVRALGMRGFLAERFAERATPASRQRRPARQRMRRPASAPSPRSSAWCCNRRALGLGAYLVIRERDVGRLDDRRLDPDVARARPDRDRGRELEGLRLGPPGLPPARSTSSPSCRRRIQRLTPAGADAARSMLAGRLCRRRRAPQLPIVQARRASRCRRARASA